MKKILNPGKSTWSDLIERPTSRIKELENTVLGIFQEVDKKGDLAVKKYTQLFDGVMQKDIEVTVAEIETANSLVSQELKDAILLAKTNIEKFHNAQQSEPIIVATSPGVLCWQEKRPIQKVGLYIPGGTAPLFSTILMLAVPAKIAGCEEVTLCTPPNEQGDVDPAILYTAGLCGISAIYKIGGIQAIAAMTFGTETIPKVSKIFGPGNQFVTVAKQFATKYGVAIDMPAGPSELLVYADDSANAAFVASDLLSQAEHGGDSQVVLVTNSEPFLDQVSQEVSKQLKELPRKAIASQAMSHSKLICIEDEKIAIDLINEYAPEHFIVVARNEDYFVKNILNAGSVFIGNYTPESAGDYASGTNHTLPTNGYAKQYSGVNLDSFLKSMTFQKISPEGIKNIGPAIEIMAEAEGLVGHKNAVSLRLKQLKNA